MGLRSSFLKTAGRLPRLLVLLAFGVGSSAVTSSCLTPTASYNDGDGDAGGGDGDANLGGANGDGDVSQEEHCTNRKVDADETDTDCGGQDCDPCALGRACKADIDCVNDSCTMESCQAPSCTDGVKNASETDRDCGGDGCPPCGDDKRCEADEDCQSLNCDGGSCAAATCSDRIKNGDESDRDCGGDCDPCDPGQDCVLQEDCKQPPEEESTTLCTDNVCVVDCKPGLEDCNLDVEDGCEVNLNTDVDNCGACDDACSPSHASLGKCVNAQCEIDFENGDCNGNWRDCNGEPDDGCEINTANSAEHCGACNEACSAANGTPACVASECEIECEGDFQDCDSDARSNGCEVDTGHSTLHCGACDNICTANPGESASCDTDQASPCLSISCDLPTDCAGEQPCGACDDAQCNDSLNTTQNCGGCGIACGATDAVSVCVDQGNDVYACEVSSCTDTLRRDCDGEYFNSCEVDISNNPLHCGGCNNAGGQNCAALQADTSLHISSISCTSSACKITGCTGTHVDCDGNPSNGCEIDLATDTNVSTGQTATGRCGGCKATDANPGDGLNCDAVWAHASGTCQNSGCVFDDCDTNWGNCVNGLSDGCETDLRVTKAHCGACGDRCVDNDGHTASNTCSSGQCNATCNSNGAKCDSNEWNGCENIATDRLNCGSCGNVCGGGGQNNVSGTPSCTGKVCQVNCSGSLCPDGSVQKLCTQPLGTTSNCSACGEVCSAQENICLPTGCSDHLPIVVAATHNFTSAVPSASTSFNLASSTNSKRGLILAFACYRGTVAPTATVSWSGGSSVMHLAHRQMVENGEASIYYLQNSELPNPGTGISISVSTTDSWGGFVGTAFEVEDLYQAGSPVDEAGGNTGGACPANNNRLASVSHEDSLIIAVTEARENSAGTGMPNGGLTEVHDAGAGGQTHGAVGYRNGVNSNVTVGFNLSLCWGSALSTATFRSYSP